MPKHFSLRKQKPREAFPLKKTGMAAALLLLAIALPACTTGVPRVPQERIGLFLRDSQGDKVRFTLKRSVVVDIPATGQRVALERGTEWFRVAMADIGDVYQTNDQLLVLKDSNAYEAWIIVKDGMFLGFLLRVQKTFVPSPIPVKLSL